MAGGDSVFNSDAPSPAKMEVAVFDLPHAPNSVLPAVATEATPLTVACYGEHDGIGMGILSNGEAYLTQRGLAALCGVQNAHIGNIGRDWHLDKPRILAVRARLARFGDHREEPHRVLSFNGRRLYCYDLAVCQAILDYYAVDTGPKAQPEAVANRVRFRGEGLKAFILDHMMPPRPIPTPLRFMATNAMETQAETWTAWTTHVWNLYLMSFWLAVAHLNTLREKAQAADWNRLGLYMPLKAILEIQTEIMQGLMNAMDRPVTVTLYERTAP